MGNEILEHGEPIVDGDCKRRPGAARRQALCVIAALSLAGCGGGDDRAEGTPPPIGFNDVATLADQATPAQFAALSARAGARTARFTVNWGLVEPARGRREWGTVDPQYARAVVAGQRPILMLLDAPEWARGGVSCPDGPGCIVPPAPAFRDDFAAFAAAVAQRYPEMLAIEIWNEPNLSLFWRGGPDPAAYAALLQAAHGTVKRARPGLPVLGGSLANAASDLDGAMSLESYLRALLPAAGGAMDGLAIHPYPYGASPAAAYRAITIARDLLAQARLSLPLWVTETGATTSGPAPVTGTQQAHVLGRVVRYLRRQIDVRAIIVHTLIERAAAPQTSTERGFGLLDADLNPKPAWCALARAAGGSKPCGAAPAAGPIVAAHARAEEAVQSAVDAALGHRRRRGSYAGLAGAPLDRGLAPGPQADPARVAVTVTEGGKRVLLCSASRGRRSYCAYSPAPGDWRYAAARGPVGAAVSAAIAGPPVTW